jgi:hypothetical protein
VYDGANYERRREISNEEREFVLAVLKYDPLGVGRSAARNFIEQVTDFGLSDFSYRSRMKVMDGSLPVNALRQVKSSRAYLGTLHEETLTGAVYVSAISSLIFLSIFVAGIRGRERIRARSAGTILWVVIGMVINAGVCGCLSGVDARYQARVIWLLPLITFLCVGRAARFHLGIIKGHTEASVLSGATMASCDAKPTAPPFGS